MQPSPQSVLEQLYHPPKKETPYLTAITPHFLLPYLMPYTTTNLFFLFFLIFIYFWDRERDRAWVGEGQRERDTESEAGSRLWAISPEPEAGLEPTDREIVTWAEVGRSTDWATQAPHSHTFWCVLAVRTVPTSSLPSPSSVTVRWLLPHPSQTILGEVITLPLVSNGHFYVLIFLGFSTDSKPLSTSSFLNNLWLPEPYILLVFSYLFGGLSLVHLQME